MTDPGMDAAPGLLLVVLVFAVTIWFYVRILGKAGYAGWWSLLIWVPVLNLVMVWVFAFANWPRLRTERLDGGT